MLAPACALAQEQSPAAQSAKNAFLAAEWQYHYYRANYLPSLTLTSSSYLNREITKPSGSGIGLSLSQSIVAQHGGIIKAKSSDRGTIFTIQLPLEYRFPDTTDLA